MPQPGNESSGDKFMNFIKNHWDKVVIGVLIVVALIFAFYGFTRPQEHLGDVFYLDQMAMLNADPTYFKYTGRDRDVLGESGQDYYLQNLMYSNSRAAGQLLEGNKAFVNQTDYLDMPPEYRPKPMSTFIGQSGNVVSQETGPESRVD